MKGHIRKRGDAWELRVYAGVDPVTRNPKYVTRTFRGGKREADAELARFVTEVAGGGHSAQDTTVAVLIETWYGLAAADLSPSTARGYRWILDRYVLPTLGTNKLARLKPADLDRFYKHLRDKGGQDGGELAAATVRQVHAILRRALGQAVKWGWIATNPASNSSPPRVRAPKLEPPNPEQVITLIEGAKKQDPDLGCYLHLAATTGARRGELCGLQWRDVDVVRGVMVISRNIVEAAHSVLVEKDTKTHSSRRIALDEGTVQVLTEHRERCDNKAQACGVKVRDGAYLFSREADGSRAWPPNDVTKWFVALRDAAGLKDVRLHDLRHFAATRLLAAGVPVRTVSGRLGHANAATTLGVYAHFLEESDREAADVLGELVAGRSDGMTRSRQGGG